MFIRLRTNVSTERLSVEAKPTSNTQHVQLLHAVVFVQFISTISSKEPQTVIPSIFACRTVVRSLDVCPSGQLTKVPPSAQWNFPCKRFFFHSNNKKDDVLVKDEVHYRNIIMEFNVEHNHDTYDTATLNRQKFSNQVKRKAVQHLHERPSKILLFALS
ncbi:hypothetical protein ANN_14134 [Periplaneta americana]|uniref:FAR1 domain-containing protein n=1 Tax=Periplaneta americana TaxID=6978 RepID=A0ABQ8SXL7_PERAM|nr:hypothetical protein ANN_14134 [Periplaneta americana]